MIALEQARRGGSEGGLTLIETMMALTLLSINLLGALSMFVAAQDGISEGAKRLEAMALAETKIERMRVAEYRALLTEDVRMEADETAVEADPYTTRRRVHGIVLTTRVLPDQPALAQSRTCTITVVAEWHDHRGRQRTVRLKMRRANPVYGAPSSVGAET
jgi:type II secretory pathway component PulJ